MVDIQVALMPQIMQIKGSLMMLLSLFGQGARMQKLSGIAKPDMEVNFFSIFFNIYQDLSVFLFE